MINGLSTVATLAGYKSHYTADGKRTLCGREVSNGTSGTDMCKACDKAAAKLTEARERLEYATRAAETQDAVMQAATPAEPTPAPAETLTEITIPRRDVVKGDMMERKNGWAKIASVTTYARTDPRTGIKGREWTRISCGGMSWDEYAADDMITVRRMVAAPVEPSPAVGAPADMVAVPMPVMESVPLILTRTPIAVVGNAPGGPNHLYGTSKGDGTGPTVADIMTRAERQGATNLRAYASDTCPEITGHYDTFRPVCVNHPNAEGAWWGKVNDRPVYFCEACNNVPVSDRPEAMERESRLREAMPLFNAMMGTRRTDSRGYVYVVDAVKFTPVRHRHTACVSVSGRVVEEYSDAADGPDRARTYGAYAGELFYDMPERETFDYATPAAPTCEHGNDGSTECAPCIAWDDAPAQTHVIEFVGDDETMCGEPVRQSMGTLRVSVDPTDATCPTCIGQESVLTALDNAPEPSDDECHRIALEEALTAAERHMGETSLYRAPAPAPAHANITVAEAAPTAAQTPSYPRTLPDGRTVWACCESSIGAPCQHRTGARSGGIMVVVEPSRADRRKVVAWILGASQTLRREFRADRTMPLHVAYWAQTHGVRPADGGRKFKWQQHETLSLAPARV